MNDAIAIVGAGMSGLSLAVTLRDLGRPVTVYEAADAPPTARTFCAFEVEDHPFAPAIRHRWPRARVVGDAERTVDLGPHPYSLIPGEAFVEHALALLAAAPDVELRFQARIDDVTALDAAHVFDSRPSPPPNGALLQVFRGRFVHAARPVFDPSCATLMDFGVDQSRGVHFVYVLPTSDTEALVEDTYFTTAAVAEAEFDATLDRWLEEHVGEHQVVDSERGTIPMTIAEPPPAPPAVTRIGLTGGVAKPSTGYAFLFAQRHASAIAAALREGRPPPASVRSATDRFLDEVFLERLRAEPEQGHRLFERLFDRVDGPRIARFLSERATVGDVRAVTSALPFGPFAKQAAIVGLRRVVAGL